MNNRGRPKKKDYDPEEIMRELLITVDEADIDAF